MQYIDDLRNLSAQDFAELGADEVAYIKLISDAEGEQYLICAGDGREIAVAEDYETATLAAHHYDYMPVWLH